MVTHISERAIEEAKASGKAILKFISANDVGRTGAHQAGFYLPKALWNLYSPNPPVKGHTKKSFVKITWPDGQITDSAVTWYGDKTRSEYRLTRFGKQFPWLTPDNVGSLLVLIPISHTEMSAYVLDYEDDIIELQNALDVEVETRKNWGVYLPDAEAVELETETSIIDRKIAEFTDGITAFPTSLKISQTVQQILESGKKGFNSLTLDKQMLLLIDTEYRLFKRIEKQLLQSSIDRRFEEVDDLVTIANSITNRRKSRAGSALEHHTSYLFRKAGIPFADQAFTEGRRKPDILIPSKAAYQDLEYPVEKLRMVGLKTTCKERWAQIGRESKRVTKKHLLTLQKGISANQLEQIYEDNITLIVPQELIDNYPKEWRDRIYTIERFVNETKDLLGIEGDGRPYPGTEAVQYVPHKVEKHKAGAASKKASSQLGFSF